MFAPGDLPRRILASGLLLLLTLAGRGAAEPSPPACVSGPAPAATLLVPYFEVDLSGADRATTLIAVTNAGDHATLAHVVLWTDWGVPTLAFDLVLAGNDVQTMNLRDLFAGNLPATGGAAFPGCTDPVTLPDLDAAALSALRRQHTGQPDVLNHCSGSGRGGADKALGYVTIDVTRRCSPTIRYPSSNGYFEAGGSGTGVASDENLLLGDFFIVDAEQNLAAGNEAVSIVADASRFEGEPATFYGGWIGHSGDDARAPLGTRYRARFLHGGAFSGGTDLVVWAEPGLATAAGVACGERSTAVDPCQFIRLTTVDEDASSGEWTEITPATEVVTRIPVGGPQLPVATLFGVVDVENRVVPLCNIPIDPPPLQEFPLQSFVLPLHSAADRFAVGFNAARIAEELCPP